MHLQRYHTSIACFFSLATISTSISSAQARQAENAQADNVELILVTGSYVRRSQNFDSLSPITVVDEIDIDAIGAKNISDIVQTLSINTGAQNNPDIFTQNSTGGTSNINLRGLGVAATLVLLNNKRQVLTAQSTNEGYNFVDTSSLVPMIAIDRVDVVKDGASALYGSDAVAGVVNFITKKGYQGSKLTLDYQDGAHGNNKEYVIQGLWGTVGEKATITAAISYTNRSPLLTGERPLGRLEDNITPLGNPGAFLVNDVPIIDPTGAGCEGNGGIPLITAPDGTVPGFDVGFCAYDIGNDYNYAADESRLSTYFAAEHQLSKNISWANEVGYARNRANRSISPSFPVQTSPLVPADHPANPFGMDVVFLGSPLANGADSRGNLTESETFRFSSLLHGEMQLGYWELSYTKAQNDFLNAFSDNVASSFSLALNGFGGSTCDPINGQPGVYPCEYFNPFATSFDDMPNSQNVLDSFVAEVRIDSKSEIDVLEALASFDLFEMAGGDAAIVFGAQWRKQQLKQDYDTLSNQDAFAFTLGNPDFDSSQDVWAVFSEIALPLSSDVDVQLALRYEDYGGGSGSTTDPKLAVGWRVSDNLAARASISTSFRAPSLFQVAGGATRINPLTDPLTSLTAGVAVRNSGNPDLKSEESTAVNLGFSLQPGNNLSVDLDYWQINFEDLIVQESAQSILSSEPQNPERVVRVGNPLTGPLQRVNNTFVNASSLETSGFDFSISYEWQTKLGVFSPSLHGTLIDSYDLDDPQVGKIDGLGVRNFTNIGVSTPELRYNLGLNWRYKHQSVNVFLRYIDSYADDQNCANNSDNAPDCVGGFKKIDSHSTIDIQYNLALDEVLTSQISCIVSIGAINIGDEEPPQVFTAGGYDSKVHDPRGRQVYARLAVEF